VLGRVSSVDLLGSYAVIPLGTFAMGPLVSTFGATATVLGGGLAVTALALGTRWTKAIRGLDTAPQPQSADAVDVPEVRDAADRAARVAG
jgi:hypothetical protein